MKVLKVFEGNFAVFLPFLHYFCLIFCFLLGVVHYLPSWFCKFEILVSKATVDTSVGMVCSMYSVDIPRYQRGHISIIQMITLVCGVEISVQCLCLLCHIGEVTFSLWYIKIIQIWINNCFK